MRNLTNAAQKFRQVIEKHREWLVDSGVHSFYLLSNEINVLIESETVRITYLDDSGLRFRTIRDITFDNGRVTVGIEGRAKGETARILFVPRVKALELRGEVETARLEAANDLAEKLSEQISGFQPIRIELNEHNGRFAEIVARKGMRQIAVLADVSGVVNHETLLSRSLIWLRNLSARKKQKIETIWIVGDKKTTGGLRALSACLEPGVASNVNVWKPVSKKKTLSDKRPVYFDECPRRKFSSLWSGRLARLSMLKEMSPTRISEEITAFDPKNIDRVYSAKGETIRYRGLPFARTRIIGGEEKGWFGIEREKCPLEEGSADEFAELVENLRCYRRFRTPNKQHEFYRASPEAWLESMLRRNIKTLDANLILSPIYNQFRAAREKIDLLALRRDGRLVIIELKVAQDRDMVFQAVDYWRKVEAQRRRGTLNEAGLFGAKEIADRPTVIYLVAPTLGFHQDLDYFAGHISDEIEMYRFDLAENWREQIRVLRRSRMGGN